MGETMRETALPNYRHGLRLLATAAAAVILAFAVAAGRPPAAAAGAPGTWSNVSGPVGSLLVQPRVVRGASGVLHVAWITEGATQDLKYRPVGAAGGLGATQVLETGWSTLSNPAIVFDGSVADDVLVFAGGIRSGAPSETHDGLNWWWSPDNGASWALQAGVVSGPAGTAYQSDVSAVVTASSLFQTWTSTFGVYTHRGVSNGGDQNVNDVGDYGYHSAFGYNALADRLYSVAAYNATGNEGLWAREIDETTGTPLGSSFKLPKSSTSYGGGQQLDMKQMPVPATGLQGRSAMVFAYPTGYPSSTTMRVWRLTTSGVTTTTLASGGSDKQATAVAADPNGRAWVVWTDSSGSRRHLYACRSNPGATTWGKTVSVLGPSGSSTLWQLAADAQSGRVDVLGQFSKGGDNVIYHTQLLAGLSVAVSPAKARVGRTFTAKVTVRDAGLAVAGATVKIGKKSATTGATGTASLKVKATKTGGLAVSVSKSGYAKGSAKIKITR
jgi:hypothetical protein